jgi:ATP-dependent Clp protease ATP-binding subunit ClpA
VVFDFIRPDVAKLILCSQVDKIIRNLSVEKRIQLAISDAAYATLMEQALGNLANGGRGIGNVVENLLINPLSRYLFDNEIFGDASVTIESIDLNSYPPELNCSKGATL